MSAWRLLPVRPDLHTGGKALFGGIVFGVLGCTTGAILGAAHPGERWEKAPDPRRIRVVVQPGHDMGAAIALSWRF